MEILEIYENKKEYLPLLLLADEQESMIDKYLPEGRMFILKYNGKVKAECVITDEGNSILEIKNIAVAPEEQKQGLGRKLIEFVKDTFLNLRRYTGALVLDSNLQRCPGGKGEGDFAASGRILVKPWVIPMDAPMQLQVSTADSGAAEPRV